LDTFTEKQKKIILFINTFGKTYAEVLGKTFFSSDQLARDFISKMKKKGLVELKKTGLIKPQNEIRLSTKTKKILKHADIKIIDNRSSIRKLSHNMIEQIAYFWLGKIGAIERKSVWHHMNVYHSVPDLVLRTETLRIHVEIETTQKSRKRYNEIIRRTSQDKPDKVLYIAESKTMSNALANAMPIWDKLSYIDIDTMIKNIKEQGKIRPFAQIGFLPKKEQDKLKLLEKYESLSAPRKNPNVEKTRELSTEEIREYYQGKIDNYNEMNKKNNERIVNLSRKVKEREDELSRLRTHHTQELEDEKSKYSKCIGVLKRLKNRTWWERLIN